ncbi:hypothetical protein [Actinoallomurus iriomotensis]|uniref:Uncharacterized protein n=1 Tax=Actinoallomurus iriomotensis TaxID=478107 RepID=A0A9W6VSL1_9ACTN|nr:hypothetical protein [Actinoallomurus iriomotensis]GLY83483.1 hypothetical protein Airi02_014130 [Actinoallomurus iriomotensis]
MDERDEQRQAADALAMVRTHQERTRRAARLPWWVYGAIFVLTAGGTAANDFVGLGGAKLIALLVLVALAAVLVTVFASRSSLLGRMRGVERRQSFDPQVFGVVLVVAAVGTWLASRYGTDLAGDLAGTVGLRDYPNTVDGVLYGAGFTLLFGLSQVLTTASRRRTNR